MPTSSAMPEVVVQIAWDGGFRIPMADWTWTDVSDYVELTEGINISWGRGDERSTADANTLSLTLDNSDGRFTAARITSPHYPNVVLYKPIRVLATPVDGTEMALFTGYVTSWPVEWEDTDAYAKATITASSRLARLGLNARWRSIVEETILADSPLVYYPLGDPEGSTLAADVSGNGAQPLTMDGDLALPVIFGQSTGPGTDDLTAATFQDGARLTGPASSSLPEFTVEAFALANEAPKKLEPIVVLVVGGVTLAAAFNTDGTVDVRRNTPGTTSTSVAVSPTSLADGTTHHLAVTVTSGGTVTLYVDGASVDSGAISALSGAATLDVGGTPEYVGRLIGVVAHVAVYDSVLSSTRIAAHADSGSSAWANESTDARFVRYAEIAGIPAAEVSAETGSTTVGHIDTTGTQIVDMLRMLEATEAGVMFDDRDGTLTLHSRSHRYGATSVVTLDMAKHEVEADYKPVLDASTLVNDITVTGVTSAHLTNEQSIEANGVATAALTTASESSDEPLNLAGWALHQFAEPRARVSTLTVDALAQVGKTITCADVMAVTLGDKVTVANHPQQASMSITDYFVEGGTFSIAPESLRITWNVTPTYAEDNIYIFDDPIYGDIDTYALPL